MPALFPLFMRAGGGSGAGPAGMAPGLEAGRGTGPGAAGGRVSLRGRLPAARDPAAAAAGRCPRARGGGPAPARWGRRRGARTPASAAACAASHRAATTYPRPPAPRQAVAKAAVLRGEGTKAFARREYAKALAAFDNAARALPTAAPERVDLFCNKAACLYQLKRCGGARGAAGVSLYCGAGGGRGRVAPNGEQQRASRVCMPCPTLHPPPGPARSYKDATKECSNALALAPTSAKALQRRARALEQQGLYKQALSDIQAVNK